MNIDNLCKLLLEALAEAGFNESTLFNYRGVIRRFKAFCKEKGYSEYSTDVGQAYADDAKFLLSHRQLRLIPDEERYGSPW